MVQIRNTIGSRVFETYPKTMTNHVIECKLWTVCVLRLQSQICLKKLILKRSFAKAVHGCSEEYVCGESVIKAKYGCFLYKNIFKLQPPGKIHHQHQRRKRSWPFWLVPHHPKWVKDHPKKWQKQYHPRREQGLPQRVQDHLERMEDHLTRVKKSPQKGLIILPIIFHI